MQPDRSDQDVKTVSMPLQMKDGRTSRRFLERNGCVIRQVKNDRFIAFVPRTWKQQPLENGYNWIDEHHKMMFGVRWIPGGAEYIVTR